MTGRQDLIPFRDIVRVRLLMSYLGIRSSGREQAGLKRVPVKASNCAFVTICFEDRGPGERDRMMLGWGKVDIAHCHCYCLTLLSRQPGSWLGPTVQARHYPYPLQALLLVCHRLVYSMISN
jgi:hypothetical protein